MDARTRLLLEGPVSSTILRLSLPNVIVMVVQTSIGLIETYFVAKLGLDALAGMALVSFPHREMNAEKRLFGVRQRVRWIRLAAARRPRSVPAAGSAP